MPIRPYPRLLPKLARDIDGCTIHMLKNRGREDMAYVIGIDTGGTYTVAVLLDMGREALKAILRKSKALTTHSRLEEGIEGSLKGLVCAATT